MLESGPAPYNQGHQYFCGDMLNAYAKLIMKGYEKLHISCS